ncbi:MAG: rhamnulokinase [Bryobacteraceae bacterium]|nr:rhamnulokinase [Bryobacteraceae bacterium]
MSHFLAVDLGAESGRAMLGRLEQNRLELEELHRFPNQPVRLPDGLYWDALRLFHEIREGLRVAGRERKLHLDGIGVDTWGVDFGIVDAGGRLVDAPRHYRDARNNGMLERTFEAAPRERIFELTGLQFMQFNSLYQLYAAKLEGTAGLRTEGAQLLFMPDLLNYWLSGARKNELTIASTSQFYNPATKQWAFELFETLGLPAGLLGEIVQPGAKLGTLLDEVADTSGLDGVPVFATAGHDTAAAVAAAPATGERPWCYISSGTWSLMGLELAEPLIHRGVLKANFTNEAGAAGRIRFLKNIAGLWLVQECRRAWMLETREYSYAQLTGMAAQAPAFQAVLDPDAFLEPGHMPERIADYCRRTGQTAPEQPGTMVRVILESLALRYRQVLELLDELGGQRVEVIHIMGGGSKNTLLNQFVADATGRTVIAGPTEATAAGNVLVQAMGAGAVRDLEEARAVVRASFPLETFEPGKREGWDAAYERYLATAARGRSRLP